ncbi:phosphatase PAP2 family protein [Aporhodopirellula aestuarii]|uniref:Phosphatase PAP2 family protein n=1 Tax=Aporhodopirellula aestuarii TaxID=2950107 RepID=A0ABT0U7X7_9BACT|nr:phosphatase PAP2 family protein [Aporhodopirellula aestuarii]MCM2372461.1 phosphatase PAP2 family protein [Aporhodopirellula aestuarii]
MESINQDHSPSMLVRAIWFVRGREPIVLLGLLTVVLVSWGFVELAGEVLEGDTDTFDRWAVKNLRQSENLGSPIGPAWLAEAGRDLTGLGGIPVLLIAIVASAGFLAINHSYRLLGVLLVSTLGGIGVSLVLKGWFSRPRPDIVPHLSHVYTSSFPSGHSMMSAVVYLTLAALIAPVLRHFWIRVYVISVAVLLTFLVGVSRVYMGVHYPTDVFAGWAAGLVWALLCWLIARAIPVRKIETQK